MQAVSSASPPTTEFRPVAVIDAELTDELPDIVPPDGGTPWRAGLIIGRVHGIPIGQVEVPLPEGGASSEYLRSAVDAALGSAVLQHVTADAELAADNPVAVGMANSARVSGQDPSCVMERRRALLDAPMLSVIVPTRDRPEQVRACVRSILACEYPRDRFEVLVVDMFLVMGSRGRLSRDLLELVRCAICLKTNRARQVPVIGRYRRPAGNS